MTIAALPPRPTLRPACAHFSSGPCAKRPGWSLDALSGALLGRSHRSPEGRAKLAEVIDRSAALLGMPDGWRLGIVPASDTGAVEMVLWALAGTRGIDVLSFESFSATWAQDLTDVLAVDDVRVLTAPYGALPDLGALDFSRDVVLTWNGTTSGVRIPDGDFIPADRDGLVICDATSAAFVMDLPWEKLDVVTWSWQKALGGEAAHGMLALSPRAVARLEQGAPRPLPKIFRLTAAKGLIEGIFRGDTINTPSMLCVEDALDSLRWAEREGGVRGLAARSAANLRTIEDWVETSDWARFLATDPALRSCTSICLTIGADWFIALDPSAQAKAAKAIATLLEQEGVALDIASYRDAPAGLRLWGGATVEQADIAALLPWLDWAHATVRARYTAAAA
ncbi:phosphoserine aminotransferase [Ameyamaea chiangmaiensis NBRC 103196]|uniref:phosphoserine transaminase n=1 Tax=Ameyamaea chiangmaiensis TaxID=442969 RepID=A0A850PFE8_9PROT|nr:phosphoserine transaminase [Ameyamaea chiangmaiensis]MBS4074810.1 phosphoserine transaminase [Ameyamaea chiangmaiensis]NVN40632.1 phosphoserine transaminase [Ameyamaea chiangmaiensis]GBQ62811.1 phosphoserine aminotransferase [Ameyamaea chiangmaiensis NBRC 103196]